MGQVVLRQARVLTTVVAMLGCAWRSAGQDVASSQPSSAPASQPTSQPSPTQDVVPSRVTAETVQARIKQIQAATGLSDEARASLLAVYAEILTQVGAAESWQAKARQFEEGRKATPELLAAVGARLRQAATQPAIDVSGEAQGEATLEQLGASLAEAEAELKRRQAEALRLDDEAKNRTDRRGAIPKLLADANRRLGQTNQELGAQPQADTSAEMTEARRVLGLARKQAVTEEIRAYEEELRFYESRGELLEALRKEASSAVTQGETTVALWQKLVSGRRQAEVERQREAAWASLRTAAGPVRDVAEKNAKLAEERVELASYLQGIAQKAKAIEEEIGKVERDHQSLRDRLKTTGMSQYMGPLLRRHQRELPDTGGYGREVRLREAEVARVGVRQLELEEEREGLGDIAAQVASVTEDTLRVGTGLDASNVTARVEKLLRARQDSVDALRRDYNEYWTDLIQLNVSQANLLLKAEAFSSFLAEHVLWTRSAGGLHRVEWPGVPVDAWSNLRSLMTSDVARSPALYGLFVFMMLLCGLSRRIVVRRLHALSERVWHPYSDAYGLTLRALLWTVLLAIPLPAILWFVAWRVRLASEFSSTEVFELGQALVGGLRASAWCLLGFSLLRQLTRPRGLGEAHFRWDEAGLGVLRRNLLWFAWVSVPAAFAVSMAEWHADDIWKDSWGRLALLIGMLSVAVFMERILHPRRGVPAARYDERKDGWVYDVRYISYAVAMLIPVALAVGSAVGYQYASVELGWRLIQTACIVLVLFVLKGLALRWLLVAQQKAALKEAKERRVAELQAAKEAGVPEIANVEVAPFDAESISSQAKGFVRGMVLFGLIVGLWFTWSGMLPAFAALERWELWSYSTEVAVADAEGSDETTAVATKGADAPVMAADLAFAVLIAALTVVLAKNLPGVLEITVLRGLRLDAGARYAAAAVSTYAVFIVGVVAAFGAIGIGWSKVQWLAAAVTVGLGFGLQEVFANFVCGLIIFFERPIRIGDIVSVGNVDGKITRIQIRATTIMDWDRRELLVPNKEFITGQLINWTLSDPVTRVKITVGVAYGSDTEKARELLLKAARACPHVTDDPEPRALFRGFGDSALTFWLMVYLPTRDVWVELMHELHTTIDQEFRAAGIEIAFPQRDLHIRSIDPGVTLGEGPRGAKMGDSGDGKSQV